MKKIIILLVWALAVFQASGKEIWEPIVRRESPIIKVPPLPPKSLGQKQKKELLKTINLVDRWYYLLLWGMNKYVEDKFILKNETPIADLYEVYGSLVYKVKIGDTVPAIAEKFCVRPLMIVAWNDLEVKKGKVILTPGRELVIFKIHWKEVTGLASWYGQEFEGRPMANGELFDQKKETIAHRMLPIGMKVQVENLKNGKKTVAEITDRGPYVPWDEKRIADFSEKLMAKLGGLDDGVTPVKITPINQNI